MKKNTDIFFQKHPDALPVSLKDAPLFFMNLATRFYDVEKKIGKDLPVITIELKDIDDLETVKSQIMNYSDKMYINLMVYDYLENSDLDIWIQKLGKKNSIPYYYPMSIYHYSKTKEFVKQPSETDLIEVI